MQNPQPQPQAPCTWSMRTYSAASHPSHLNQTFTSNRPEPHPMMPQPSTPAHLVDEAVLCCLKGAEVARAAEVLHDGLLLLARGGSQVLGLHKQQPDMRCWRGATGQQVRQTRASLSLPLEAARYLACGRETYGGELTVTPGSGIDAGDGTSTWCRQPEHGNVATGHLSRS